MDVKKEALCRD